MSSKLFEVMKLLESRRLSFTIERTGPFDLKLMVTLVGKRVEIRVDEGDFVNVCAFRGSEERRNGNGGRAEGA